MNTLTFDKGLIKEIQEWAYVYFVKFIKGRPQFVSKKNNEVKQMNNQTLFELLKNIESIDACPKAVYLKTNKQLPTSKSLKETEKIDSLVIELDYYDYKN